MLAGLVDTLRFLEQCFSTHLASRNSVSGFANVARPHLTKIEKKRVKPERNACILLLQKLGVCAYAWLHGLCTKVIIV